MVVSCFQNKIKFSVADFILINTKIIDYFENSSTVTLNSLTEHMLHMTDLNDFQSIHNFSVQHIAKSFDVCVCVRGRFTETEYR